MEIYKFRCKGCGSTKCERIDERTFKCIYCGEFEEILPQTKTDKPKSTEPQTMVKTPDISEFHKKTEQTATEEKIVKKDNSSVINAFGKFLICIFLGMFGVHRFMEGKIFSGIIYAFTFGLFSIGWIIDCIVLLCNFLSEGMKYLGGENG